jgi:two-component system OmpR family sensor kinase
VGLAGLLAAGLLSRVSAPKWFRQPMVAALLFCTASSVLAQWGPGESAGRTAAALGLDVIWTGLVTYSSVRLATFSWSRQLAMAEEQARRMVQAEQEVKRDEEMLHELRSTLAGISSAAQLLCLEPGPIDPTRMSHLGRTLTQELARVERLLSPDAPRPAEVVDLAEAIDPVIECARANGQVVRWRPPRIAVFGHPDDIAEAMHALLANARRHAPGSVVKLVTRRRENVVELSVRDAGPGVAGDVGDRLFSRGARGSASVGQGLGLYVARQRLAEHGGGLALAPAPRGGGAEFVLRLPLADPRHRQNDALTEIRETEAVAAH